MRYAGIERPPDLNAYAVSSSTLRTEARDRPKCLGDLGGGDACHKGCPNCLALPVLQCGGRLG